MSEKEKEMEKKTEGKVSYTPPQIIEKNEIKVELLTSDIPVEPPPPAEGP